MDPKHGGFSLIEATVVLAIAAVGLTIALPSFDDSLRRNRVTTAMHMLMTDMAMARSTAIMRTAQVVVCPGSTAAGCSSDRNWTAGWIVFVDQDGDRQPEAPADVLRVSMGPSSTGHALGMRSTRPYLRYQQDGRSAHSNLTVHVCAGALLEGKLVVNNLGRVRSERPAPPPPCPAT